MKCLFLKIDNRIKYLSDAEAYTYANLVYSVFTGKEITRKYLSVCTGYSEEYIKDILLNIYNIGLIEKEITRENNTFNGTIKTKVHYTMNYDKFFKVGLNFITDNIANPRLIGFAIKLRSLAFDDSLRIPLNKKHIAEELGITTVLLNKRLKELETIGFKLEKLENSYKIVYDEKYLPLNNKCYLDEDHIRIINNVLEVPSNSKLYNQTRYFLTKKMHYQFNANELYDDILAGIFGRGKILEEESKEKITFDF